MWLVSAAGGMEKLEEFSVSRLFFLRCAGLHAAAVHGAYPGDQFGLTVEQ